MEFNFLIGFLLGKGTFGIVKKCYSKIDFKYYAIKWIEKEKGKIDFKEI